MTWFVGGNVFTGRGVGPQALDFRVIDGRITEVSPTGERALSGDTVHDRRGCTVLPGLLDVHIHPGFMSTLVDQAMLLPPAVTSIAEVVEAMRACPSVGQGPQVWIEGFGWDESGYPEGRQPNRHDLDQVSTTQPVFIRRCDVHSAVVNTVALQRAGITAATPDPPGGEFGREDDGTPDGRLTEFSAMNVVADLIPSADSEQRIERVARMAAHLFERGIVGVGDPLATLIPDPLPTFRAAAERGPFPQTGLYLGWEQIKDAPPDLTDDDRTGRVHVAGVKLFMDGAYSNRTAWTHDAYPGSCSHGIATTTPDELRAAARWARENQVQMAVHAMGDAALDAVIDLFGDEEPWLGDVPSIRVEHATLATPERIARIASARMNFAVISHSIFFFAEYGAYEKNLSPSQFQIAYPIRSYYEGLSATALASDAPSTAWSEADDAFVSIKAAVLRRSHTGADFGLAEAITVSQGVELFTSRAAQTMSLDGLGLIAPGYEASFVVLDRDLFEVPSEEIDQVQIAETWLAGEQVFVRG